MHKPLFVPGVQFLTEFVFTRVIHNCEVEKHGRWLRTAADLCDRGLLKPTVETFAFSADGLRAAQEKMERGTQVGKAVLAL